MENRPDQVFADSLISIKEGAIAQTEEPQKESSPPATSAPKALTQKSVFSHPDAHPVALDLVLLKHFEVEWFTWMEDTLFREIELTFNTSIAEVNKLKILAARSLHVIDAFWEHWEIFEKTIMALNGVVPQLKYMQPPDLSFLMAGVDMVNGIRKEEFSDEISRYCAAVFMDDNVHYAPAPLDFCQIYLSQPVYKCQDCGKVGDMLPPFDGLCSSCAGHYLTDTPFSMKPDPDREGMGKNLKHELTYNPGPIKARLDELDALPAEKLREAIREVPEDIAAAKLIIAIDFKNYRAQQLKEQLESLRGWLEAS